MSNDARSKATIYVAGLDSAVDMKILTDAFLPFGEITDVSLPKPELPSSTDPHRGFGYVEFESPTDAKEAIDNMDQSELFGRVIKVSPAKPQQAASEGLGSSTAVWTQEAYISKYMTSTDADQGTIEDQARETVDSMQSLEGLDIAGPQAV